MSEDRSAAAGPRTPIPLTARLHLAHAVVQHVAEECGADLLHLKGAALLPGLREQGKLSTDVDVLVRPGHAERLRRALSGLGWEQRTDRSASAFGHAENWWHDDWGYCDLHTSWPGATASPEAVFDALAEPGSHTEIAHVRCPTPDRVGQLFVLVLHAARSSGRRDLDHAWASAGPAEQDAVTDLVRRLGAEVAFAAAVGGLEGYTDRPEYELWRVYSSGGGNRLDEWRARLAAERSWRGRAGVLRRMLPVNRGHLAMELGRRPTRADVWRRQGTRARRLLRDALGTVRR